MNTYNDNLQAAVNASLQSQELDRKKMKSEANASLFTLYHAQGAVITAAEKRELADRALTEKKKAREDGVRNSTLSTNVLLASTQEKQYVDQSVTNSAVCAANVQVAANAVAKLASDVGAINSFANVADSHTSISKPYNDVFKLISNAAYNAEVASQTAMEAAYKTAEVSSDTVNNNATLTDASVKELLKTVTTEFNTASELVTNDNEALAEANIAYKKAKGNMDDVGAEYTATRSAYNTMNDELNLNLKVLPASSGTEFLVSFEPIKYPFLKEKDTNSQTQDIESDFFDLPKPPYNTATIVDSYYAIVVKDEKKFTFSKADASRLIQLDKDKVKGSRIHKFDNTNVNKWIILSTDGLLDSDGDKYVKGNEYVVFITAKYSNDYMNYINNYEDYLSAPSFPFKTTTPLQAPDPQNFKYEEVYKLKKGKEIEVGNRVIVDFEPEVKITQEKTGVTVEGDKELLKNPDLSSKIVSAKFWFSIEVDKETYMADYRCMFLPNSRELIGDLQPVQGCCSNNYDVDIIGEINNLPILSDLLQLEGISLKALKEELQRLKKEKGTKKEIKEKQREINEQKKLIAEIESQMAKEQQDIENWIHESHNEMLTINPLPANDGSSVFCFNLNLAEQVAAGNYFKMQIESKKPIPINPTPGQPPINFEFTFDDETTDVYGNPLISGNSYIPVVLAVPDVKEDELNWYASALSDISATSSIIYDGPKKLALPLTKTGLL